MTDANKPSEQELVNQIKDSIAGMQEDMKATYEKLSSEQIVGKSSETPDPYVQIILRANYELIDLLFEKEALQGGVTEFKHRIKTAWKDALTQVQQVTQARTMELLQGMQIPEHLRGLDQKEAKDEGDE